VADAGAVVTDAAAAPAAPASLPTDVAWITDESSISVAALQHLIDAVHSFTGLNWLGFS
jgi:YidC/Oxa1 family membrane protein insertase